MNDSITVAGIVATDPRHLVTAEGTAITSFRLASPQRHYDRRTRAWVDGPTNWFTVAAFRQLAINTGQSLHRGDRVLVAGRLKVRDWTSGERQGITVEIEAERLGHDLSWGTSSFARSPRKTAEPATERAAAEPVERTETSEPDPALAATPF